MNGSNIIAAVLPKSAAPLDSYAPDFLLKIHPSVFPWGKGQKPKNMSSIEYYRILLERVPLNQYGQNVALLFDMFDQWQRHEVNLQANIMIKGSPHIVNQINNLTQHDVKCALDVVGKSGSTLNKARSALTRNAKTFLGLLRRVGARIPGSPQAKLALRSKAIAAPIVFGSATVMANLCPAEIACKWVFEMGEPRIKYEFNTMTGEPDSTRPPKLESLRWAEENLNSLHA